MSVFCLLNPVEDCLYDIYLSCVGQRVHSGLAYNLYLRLISEGYSVFLDDMQIGPGEDINAKINKAIYNSRVFVPIFSDEYSTSVDTLNQLEKIMYLCKAGRRTVFPLYLDALDRIVVGKQLGTYATAFAEHERGNVFKEEKLKSWQGALAEAAGIRGLSLNDFRTEADFIDKVVEVIKKVVDPTVAVVSSHSSWNIFRFFRWSGSSEVGDGQAKALVGKV